MFWEKSFGIFDFSNKKTGRDWQLLPQHKVRSLHIQIPPDRLRRSHMMQYPWGYCKLEYHWEYFKGTMQLLHAWYVCHSNCSVPSAVLQFAVASTVLHHMKPTQPVGGILMCMFDTFPYISQYRRQVTSNSHSGFFKLSDPIYKATTKGWNPTFFKNNIIYSDTNGTFTLGRTCHKHREVIEV